MRRTIIDCCTVCGNLESTEDNPIVFCDGCNVAVHAGCYAVSSEDIEAPTWFCLLCKVKGCTSGHHNEKCEICHHSGGAMYRCRPASKRGGWVHASCALFLPEIQIDGDTADCSRLIRPRSRLVCPPVDKKFNIYAQRCTLCKRKGGACAQCNLAGCYTAFHVHCAVSRMLYNEEFPTDKGTVFALYCDAHHRHMARASRDSKSVGYQDGCLAISVQGMPPPIAAAVPLVVAQGPVERCVPRSSEPSRPPPQKARRKGILPRKVNPSPLRPLSKRPSLAKRARVEEGSIIIDDDGDESEGEEDVAWRRTRTSMDALDRAAEMTTARARICISTEDLAAVEREKRKLHTHATRDALPRPRHPRQEGAWRARRRGVQRRKPSHSRTTNDPGSSELVFRDEEASPVLPIDTELPIFNAPHDPIGQSTRGQKEK